ncbi:MAG: tRNA lysidine(34) synthetase TilS [Bacteroidales bacterium]
MKEEFQKYLAACGIVREKHRILMAVSGGIDSMVMSHLLKESGYNAAIAHCNFSLRGEESDSDEEFVRNYAEINNIPFFSVRFDTTGFAGEKGISIQMAARELRYRWFEEIRESNGCDFIALAHNMNDNVETFLINLTRGTGLAGLTGMRSLHKKLLRPLLFASRAAISEYAATNGIIYREDRTNADVKYTRNKIRHTVIPVFREINPSFDLTITETAERLSEISGMIASIMDPLKEKALSRRGENYVFKIKEVPDLPFRNTILFELFRPFGISSGQVRDLEKLIKGRSGSMLFTGSWRLIRSRGEIIITPAGASAEVYIVARSLKELNDIDFISEAVLLNMSPDFKIPGSPGIACLDAGKVKFPLIIRSVAPGDWFCPLGMKSRKKLSDYFIDRKYSIDEKEKKLVMESEGNITWILGDRLDNRFSITDKTTRILRIGLK